MAGKPAISGVQELNRALTRMGVDAGDLTRVNQSVAGLVATRASDLVPVRSGRLRSSIKPRASKLRGSVKAGSRAVPYAGPIHFGWPVHNIAPQPFLYQALDERRGEIVRRYAEQVETLVKRLDRETPG